MVDVEGKRVSFLLLTAGLINMNEDNMSYSAQGGAAMPGAVEAQMAAEEGFVTMLQRDLARQKAQVQRLSTIEVKYQVNIYLYVLSEDCYLLNLVWYFQSMSLESAF